MENQFSAVKRPIRIIGKANNPTSAADEKPACNPYSTFLINAKDVCLWPLADPQGFFIEAKTVCESAPKLKIKSLSSSRGAIPGCIAEILCVRLQPAQRVALMGGRERQLVLQQIVPILLQAKAVRMTCKCLFHFAARFVCLLLN